MAKRVLKDAYIQVNGVDLSDHCSSVTVASEAEQVDVTAFTTAGYRQTLTGFKTAEITATFFQDYDAASVHQTLQPLYDAGGTFTVNVKASQTTTSSTNPRITLGTATLNSYSPLAGAVGEASTMDVTFTNAGTAGITYGTTGSP